MPANLKVSASLEDYLEAIYHTVEAKGAARAKDIVMRLGVHNSSVTQALRSLSEKELINYAPYDVITLTDKARRIPGVTECLAEPSLTRPEWLHWNEANGSATVVRTPDANEVPFPVNIQDVVEFYAVRL